MYRNRFNSNNRDSQSFSQGSSNTQLGFDNASRKNNRKRSRFSPSSSFSSPFSSQLDHDRTSTITTTTLARQNQNQFREKRKNDGEGGGGKDSEERKKEFSRMPQKQQCDGTKSIMIQSKAITTKTSLSSSSTLEASSNASSSLLFKKYGQRTAYSKNNDQHPYSSFSDDKEKMMIPGLIAICTNTNNNDNKQFLNSSYENTMAQKIKRNYNHDEDYDEKIKQKQNDYDDNSQNTKKEEQEKYLSIYVTDGHETFFGRIESRDIKGCNLPKKLPFGSSNSNSNSSMSSSVSLKQSSSDRTNSENNKIELIQQYLLYEPCNILVSYQLIQYHDDDDQEGTNDNVLDGSDVNTNPLNQQQSNQVASATAEKRKIYLTIREKLSNGVVRIIFSGSFYLLRDDYDYESKNYSCDDDRSHTDAYNKKSQNCSSSNIISDTINIGKTTSSSSSSTLPVLNLLSQSLTNTLNQISTLQTQQITLQQNLRSWKDTTQKLDTAMQSEKDIQFDLFLTLYNRVKQDLRSVKQELQEERNENNLLRQRQQQLQIAMMKQKQENVIIDREEEHDYVNYDPKQVELLAAGPVVQAQDGKHSVGVSRTKAAAKVHSKKGKSSFDPSSTVISKDEQRRHANKSDKKAVCDSNGSNVGTSSNSTTVFGKRKKNPFTNVVEVWNPEDLFPSDDDSLTEDDAVAVAKAPSSSSSSAAATSKPGSSSSCPKHAQYMSSESKKDAAVLQSHKRLRCVTTLHDADIAKVRHDKKRKKDGENNTKKMSLRTPTSTSSSKSSLSPRRSKNAFRYDNFSDEEDEIDHSSQKMGENDKCQEEDDDKKEDKNSRLNEVVVDDDDDSCRSEPLL